MPKTLIIDNGSYSVKIGYASENVVPHTVSNSIVRTKDKRLLIGELIEKNPNISGCIFKRPYEKGQLISWETEKLVWDYCFNSKDLGLFVEDNDPHEMDLVLTHSPFTLPKITKNTDQIVFEEYGFNRYFKNIAAGFVPFSKTTDELYNSPVPSKSVFKDFQLVVDSGFDATYVVPIVYGVVYWPGVKKLDIGGRFLTGFLRELISFRYYDVTDETVLVNNIKEQICFVPENYSQSLDALKREKAMGKPCNDKSMIVEYALPDYKTTTTGYLVTDANRAKNIVDDLQIMKLYDERFSIPETLFDPAIAGIKHRNGLVKTIYDSIYASPEIVRPMLASNIVCVGGNFSFPGLQHRLETELKSVLPVEWDIRICVDRNPSEYSWKSANDMVQTGIFNKICVDKSDYFEKGWGYINEELSRWTIFDGV